MEYAVNANWLYPAFLYDDNRKCNKFCLFIKTVGFGFYSTSMCMCTTNQTSNFVWFCIVISPMFISICNTIRYEYALHKKNGTIFPSIDEFIMWKTQQRPYVKSVLDYVELAIKIVFFGKTFPPTFAIHDSNRAFSMCQVGITVLTLHTLSLFVMWGVCMTFLFFMCVCMYTRVSPPMENNRDNELNQQIQRFAVEPNAPIIRKETECCICLDKNEEPWIIAQCMHSFHATCMTEWMKQNPSCPICRLSLVV